MVMQYVKNTHIHALAFALAALASTGLLAAEAETSTMEPGTVQLEFKWGERRNTHDADITARVRSTPFLVRIGIAGSTELRIETEGHAKATETVRATGFKQSASGIADASMGVRGGRWTQTKKRGVRQWLSC
jgi:hypothetical protein